MKNKFVLVFLAFIGLLNAQKSNFDKIVTFSLVSPVLNQRYELGLMNELNERWWLGAEAGIGVDGTVPKYNPKVYDFFSWSLKPELFYCLTPDRKAKHFLSAQIFYADTQRKIYDGNYYDKAGNYYVFDDAHYRKTKGGINLNYSFLLHKEESHFGFMPKVGIGLGSVKIQYNEVVNPQPQMVPVDDITLDMATNSIREGKSIRVNLVFDVKVTYRF